MRLIILAAALIPLAFASTCSLLNSCYECDSQLDANGNQECSWCSSSSSCVPKSGLECVFGTKISDVYDCPIPVRKGFEYNDTLSRKMIIVAGAAYGNNPEVCLKKDAPDLKVYKQVTVKCDDNGDTCSALTAVSEMEKAIAVAFRGTYGDLQLLIEAGNVIFQKKCPLEGGGMIAQYFSSSFFSVWNNGIREDLKELLALYPDYSVWVTGHSMGAALAAIAANVMVYEKVLPAEQIKLISFGEPRVGDKDYAIAHDKLLPYYSYRVTHHHDLVPHLPPEDLLLGYHHHRYEVWYDNDMKPGDAFTVCFAPEDKECSDKNLFNTSPNDHRYYFGVDLLDLINNGCRE